MPHDVYYLRKWLSEAFHKHHLVEVEPDEAEAKKRSEELFQKRGVRVNTVVCISAGYGSSLMAEVSGRQDEFRADPGGLFVTRSLYPYYERGGSGSDQKRAKFKGLAYMVYGVLNEYNQGFYKIHHLEMMSATPTLPR